MTALLDRYGDATVDAAIVELKRRAARQMREKIATIPDGVYDGEAFVDSDGVVDEPLTHRHEDHEDRRQRRRRARSRSTWPARRRRARGR